MQNLLRSFLLGVALISLVGCGGGIVNPGPAGVSAQSELPRDTVPDVVPDDLVTVVDGNSEFAFELYRHLSMQAGDGAGAQNVFYSPHSISIALAMTYAGARGDTEQQMAETLHFTLPQERLHSAFNALDLELESRGEGAEGKDDKGFRLNVVNAIWGQVDYKFLPEFLDTLAQNYGAGLRLVNFVGATEEARVTINDWVSEQTEGRIKDLIPTGMLTSLTRLVLTNAVYFNAAWATPFEEYMTQDGDFYLLDGSPVTVPLMQQTHDFRYIEGSGYKAVELPYDGYELSMFVVLPDEGQFSAFEDGLDFDTLAQDMQNGNYRQVALTLPKFEFESEFNLSGELEALGMVDAFSADADFSGMDGTHELFISEVIHKAFVAVDEEGTEAAAATAVVMEAKGMPLEETPVEFKVDRPFLFFIQDIKTGAILFVGRVVNPA